MKEFMSRLLSLVFVFGMTFVPAVSKALSEPPPVPTPSPLNVRSINHFPAIQADPALLCTMGCTYQAESCAEGLGEQSVKFQIGEESVLACAEERVECLDECHDGGTTCDQLSAAYSQTIQKYCHARAKHSHPLAQGQMFFACHTAYGDDVEDFRNACIEERKAELIKVIIERMKR